MVEKRNFTIAYETQLSDGFAFHEVELVLNGGFLGLALNCVFVFIFIFNFWGTVGAIVR